MGYQIDIRRLNYYIIMTEDDKEEQVNRGVYSRL